jgi:hypothetical protein
LYISHTVFDFFFSVCVLWLISTWLTDRQTAAGSV